MRALIAPFAVMLALSGCLSEDAGDNAPADAEAVPETPSYETLTEESSFGWTLAAGVPATGQDIQFEATNAATFTVPHDAVNLTVTADWDCLSVDCTLHVYLYAPGMSPVGTDATQHTTGAGSASFQVMEPERGDWTIAVHTDLPTVDTAGTFAWSVEAPVIAPGDNPARS